MAGREQVIAALKAAYVQGRLTKEEFDLRVGQALAIYAELDALTADIPAAPPAVTAPAAAEPAVTARAELAREAANKKMIRQGTAGVAGLTFVLVTASGGAAQSRACRNRRGPAHVLRDRAHRRALDAALLGHGQALGCPGRRGRWRRQACAWLAAGHRRSAGPPA